MKDTRPLNMPTNRLTFEETAQIFNISVMKLKKILWMIKFDQKNKWQIELKNPETETIATYRIEKSTRVSGGLALFVKTDGAALLNGVSALIEFELQIFGTTGRWIHDICDSCFDEVQSACK